MRQFREGTIELLDAALGQFGSASPGVLGRLWHRPASRSPGGVTTRQARHARLVRNRAMAIAGALALAPREKDFASLLLSSDVARLRPYSAIHHMKVVYLAETQNVFSRQDCEALWELGAAHLLHAGRRSMAGAGDEGLSVNTALCALFVGCILHGPIFASEWRSLRRAARRVGLLESRYVQMQLSIMGSWVGDCGAHVDWLLDEHNWSFEMTDALGFVRRDVGASALAADIDRIQGNVPDARSLGELAGGALIDQLADYVRAVMRQSQHFHNEGLVLMVLTWIEALARHLHARGAPGALDEDMIRLASGLDKIERVQHLEKSRFFRVWEPMSRGPVKDHLIRLWSRSYSQPID